MIATRMLAGLLAFSSTLVLSSCSADPAGPAEGRLTGAVTVVGDLLPDGNGSGEVFLLPGPDASKTDALRREALRGGPHAYSFSLDAVPPGTYYLEACLRFAAGLGCAPFTTDSRGNPTPVEVRSGRHTEVQIRF